MTFYYIYVTIIIDKESVGVYMVKPSRKQISLHVERCVYKDFKEKCVYDLLPMNVVLEFFMQAFIKEDIVLNVKDNKAFFSLKNEEFVLSKNKTSLNNFEKEKELHNTSVNADLYSNFTKKCSRYNLTVSFMFEIFMKQYSCGDFSLSLK